MFAGRYGVELAVGPQRAHSVSFGSSKLIGMPTMAGLAVWEVTFADGSTRKRPVSPEQPHYAVPPKRVARPTVAADARHSLSPVRLVRAPLNRSGGWLNADAKERLMTAKKFPSLLPTLLTLFVITANAQETASIVDRIARSLPDSEAGWKLIGTDSSRHADGSTQASLRWTNEGTEKGATVIVYRTATSAKRAFRPHGKADLQEAFRIDGVGDEAFLWPPKAPRDGAYNIRFRKAQVEVWMHGRTEEEVKRYARILVGSITPPN